MIHRQQLPDTRFLYELFHDSHDGKFDTNPNTHWFMSYVDDELVGVVNAEERGAGVWYFAGGVVKPAHRQRGIWSELHQQRTDYVISQGAKILFAISSPMNRRAFEAEGWTRITSYDYSHDFDEVVYFRCIQ
jgi:GNAT superfamily N-acetyltransferase